MTLHWLGRETLPGKGVCPGLYVLSTQPTPNTDKHIHGKRLLRTNDLNFSSISRFRLATIIQMAPSSPSLSRRLTCRRYTKPPAGKLRQGFIVLVVTRNDIIPAVMAQITFRGWWLVGLIAAYVLLCVRVALRMKRIGRSPVAWFFITMLLTALPAAIVLLRHHKRQALQQPARESRPASLEGPLRCPHCGRVIVELVEAPGGIATCPQCGLPVERERPA